MTIENIATKMRVLASEIGGNHHSPEEAQDLLNDLADQLSEVNMNISIKLHDTISEADGLLGINNSYRFLYQRQKNIKENEDTILNVIDKHKAESKG